MTNYVGVGKGSLNAGGYAFRAPLGTALPTSANASLASGYTNIGLVSSDGVTGSSSETSNKTRDWADKLVKTWSTDRTETIKLTYIETSPSVLEEYRGNATGTATQFSSDRDGVHPERIYVFDSIIDDCMLHRTVVPRGRVTAIDDIQEYPGGILGYPVTITAEYDSTAGYTIRDYYKVATSGTTGN